MKKLLMTGPLVALAALGCDNVETALWIKQVVTPGGGGTGACTFSPTNEGQLSIQFDVAGPHLFTLPLAVENQLIDGTIEINRELKESFRYPNDVSPLYFDLRWECDTNAFGNDLGAIYLPHYSVDQPFCLDRLENTSGRFRGFDFVPASGGAVPAGGESIVDVRPISAQLAQAFDDFFTLAVLAETCCQASGSCKTVTEQDPSSFPAGTACASLRDLFNALAPGKLSTTRESDLQKFRPFAIFDGDFYRTRVNPAVGPIGRSPAYALRMRGTLQGVTGDGKQVTSSEFREIISICRDCGGSTGCTDR